MEAIIVLDFIRWENVVNQHGEPAMTEGPKGQIGYLGIYKEAEDIPQGCKDFPRLSININETSKEVEGELQPL